VRLRVRMAQLEARLPSPIPPDALPCFRGLLPGSEGRWAEYWLAHPGRPALEAKVRQKWPSGPLPANFLSDDECWALMEAIYVPWDEHERELKRQADGS
jgi:hypothetical protein